MDWRGASWESAPSLGFYKRRKFTHIKPIASIHKKYRPHIMDNVGRSVQLNGMSESLYKTQNHKIRTLWIMIIGLTVIVIVNKHSSAAVFSL
jgi:hypothetical protein